MQHLPPFHVMQSAIRGGVCTRCSQRPPGSEALSPMIARPCEGQCALFLHLPRLVGIAAAERGQICSPYETSLREKVCSTCELSATAGDYCLEHMTRSCPLSRYAADAMAAIERLLPGKAAVTRQAAPKPKRPTAA